MLNHFNYMKIAIKVLTEWDRENFIPFFEKHFPNCNKYNFTTNGADLGEVYIIINGGLETVDEYNNKHLDLSDYTILQGVPKDMELPKVEENRVGYWQTTKTREQELEELVKLAQQELYLIHSQYGDKLQAEEHSVFLTKAKQLLNQK